MQLKELRQRRERAAHRHRRIIFNNDGCDMVYRLEGKEISAQSLLDDRTTRLRNTHVDSIFYVSWSAGLGLCTHKSAVAEPFVAKTGVFETNMTQEYHEAGLDPLQIMIDFSRVNDIEIFWSMRMNDIHDADPRWPEMIPQFKKDHPQFLFGTQEQPPAFGCWSGFDYGRPEVRERAFRLLEDVCERYDVDGIEMDFLRHIPHFRCNAEGEDCTQKERDTMTGLLRRVRDMTEQVGLKRGRPLLVALRLPASLRCCEALGLDVTQWLEQGLADILVPGELELSPWEGWVALGHQHGVPVYPCLSWTGSKKRQGPSDVQGGLPLRSFRSRAMKVWHAGADGVYTFNLFDPASSLWRELGDPEVLAGLDRDYFPHGYWRALLGRDIRDLHRFAEVPIPPYPERPVALEPDQPCTVTLTIGEDLSGTGPAVELNVRIAGLKSAEALAVKLNDHAVKGSLTEGWVRYAVAPEWIQSGANTVEITSRSRPDNAILLEDLHVRLTGHE